MNDTASQKSDLGVVFTQPRNEGGKELETHHDEHITAKSANTKESHLSNQTDVFDVSRVIASSHGETGTIVSDKHRRRPSLGQNLRDAFQEWWGKAQANIAEKMKLIEPLIVEKGPTVTSATARKETIKEAAKNATIAPRDDSHIVIQQFHTLKGDIAHVQNGNTITIKPQEKKTEKETRGSWAHIIRNEKNNPSPLSSAMPDLRGTMIAPDINKKIPARIEEYIPVEQKKHVEPSAKMQATPVSQTPPTPPQAPVSVPPPAPSPRVERVVPVPSEVAPQAPTKSVLPTPLREVTPPPQSVPPVPVYKPVLQTQRTKVQTTTPSVAEKLISILQTEKTSVETQTVSVPQTPPTPPQAPVSVPPPAPSPRVERVVPVPSEVAPQAPTKSVLPTPLREVTPPPQSVRHVPPSIRETVPPAPSTPVISVLEKPTPPRSTAEVAHVSTIPNEKPVFHTPETNVRDVEQTRVKEQTSSAPSPRNVTSSETLHKIHVVQLLVSAGIILLVLVGYGVYSFIQRFAEERATLVTREPLFVAEHVVPVSFTGSTDEFIQTFTSSIAEVGPRTIAIELTEVHDNKTEILTAEAFLRAFKMGVPNTLLKALDPTFMLGAIVTTQAEPFLIIRTYNFDVLFAGMLAWENTLAHDLAPFFGISTPSDTHFKDAVRNNSSTRILFDEVGNEVLLYSFVNQNTVIITTSGEALSALIEKF